MKKLVLLLSLCSSAMGFAGVTVSAPANGSNVTTVVQYVAKASTNCTKGVSAIGMYSRPGILAYGTSGDSINTELTLSPGDYQTVVQAWDSCGGFSKTPISIHVSEGAPEVQVIAPSNNSNVATRVQFVASSSTACPKGVAAMGVYTAPGVLAYHSDGTSLNTLLTLNPGTYHTVVQEWDRCGGSASTPVTINVAGPNKGGQVKVSTPQANTTVSATVQYVASATSSCHSGVAAMGIYTSAGVLAYTTQRSR